MYYTLDISGMYVLHSRYIRYACTTMNEFHYPFLVIHFWTLKKKGDDKKFPVVRLFGSSQVTEVMITKVGYDKDDLDDDLEDDDEQIMLYISS